MPYTNDEIDQFVLEFPASTDEQLLLLLREARRQLVYAQAIGEATIVIEIRQRRVQVADPVKMLEYLDRRIADLELSIGRKSKGPPRNFAHMRRGL